MRPIPGVALLVILTGGTFALSAPETSAAPQAGAAAEHEAGAQTEEKIPNPATVVGNVEVLTDTRGVDFGPYLSKAIGSIRKHWYSLIPAEAKPPELKQGRVSIEFVILRDGNVGGMKFMGPSGDVALDRAAWEAIQAGVPFAPLPDAFKGQYLGLRVHFAYNPPKGSP